MRGTERFVGKIHPEQQGSDLLDRLFQRHLRLMTWRELPKQREIDLIRPFVGRSVLIDADLCPWNEFGYGACQIFHLVIPAIATGVDRKKSTAIGFVTL